MRRPVTHWYTKDQPIFENTEEMPDCRIDVTRIPGGDECLTIPSTWGREAGQK